MVNIVVSLDLVWVFMIRSHELIKVNPKSET